MEGGLLVAGLGNPGPKYDSTRHNLGFMVADELCARAAAIGWQDKFHGEICKIRMGGRTALLLKPMTFMNLSGKSVARAAVFHRFEPDEMIVIHDDLDMEFGRVVVKKGGGTGGHKGLASCKEFLGNADFLRVRIGIGRPQHGDVTNFVLQQFSSEERISLTDVIARGADAVETIASHGEVKAMNEFNKRQGDN